MAKAPKSDPKQDTEEHWHRFEHAVDAALRTPAQHRPPKKSGDARKRPRRSTSEPK